MAAPFRVLTPQPGIYAFYEGRDETTPRTASWVDDGALSLGIASYAIADGDEALVYDTHVSVDRAKQIRAFLEAQGVRKFTVVLSHWHLDHISGNEAFSDCRIIANAQTQEHLQSNMVAIESGTLHGPPPISPLVLANETFEDSMQLRIGNATVDLLQRDIHSDDATVLWLAEQHLLLAGDTLEDTITYVAEPENLESHIQDLDHLYALKPHVILPNHGDPEIIAAGGYERTLIRATQQYVRLLIRCRTDAELRNTPLQKLVAGPLEAGWINYFEPYEEVHRKNLECVIKAA